MELAKYDDELSGFSKSSLFREVKIAKLNGYISIWYNSTVELLSRTNPKYIRTGASEVFFYKMLMKYLGHEVYTSVQFFYYYPDIIIKHSSGLIIDIEIDEPYSYYDKNPIHYDDVDDDRDKFFLDKGVLIIKFSENQILDYPENCIQIIHETINFFLRMKPLEDLNERINELIEVDFWDYKKAFNLAYSDSRKEVIQRIRKLANKYQIEI